METIKTVRSFNSLQTGRHIQRDGVLMATGTATAVSIPFKREGISKAADPRGIEFGQFVSIPFKREGISKVTQKTVMKTLKKIAFQFPSNGKAYPK